MGMGEFPALEGQVRRVLTSEGINRAQEEGKSPL